MALDHASTGKEWNKHTLVERKEYVVSLAKTLTVIDAYGRTIDGVKLFALTEAHFSAGNVGDKVLNTMGKIIRDKIVG